MDSSFIAHSILMSISFFQRDNFSLNSHCHRIQSKPALEETMPIISETEVLIHTLGGLAVCPPLPQSYVSISFAVVYCSEHRAFRFHSGLPLSQVLFPVSTHSMGPSDRCDMK